MKREHWQDWIVLGAACWLFYAPRALSFDPSAHTASWVALIVSVALFLSALFALFRPHAWEELMVFLIGIALLFSPWFLGYDDDFIPASNAILIGFLVAVIAGFGLVREVEYDTSRHDWTAHA